MKFGHPEKKSGHPWHIVYKLKDTNRPVVKFFKLKFGPHTKKLGFYTLVTSEVNLLKQVDFRFSIGKTRLMPEMNKNFLPTAGNIIQPTVKSTVIASVSTCF